MTRLDTLPWWNLISHHSTPVRDDEVTRIMSVGQGRSRLSHTFIRRLQSLHDCSHTVAKIPPTPPLQRGGGRSGSPSQWGVRGDLLRLG